MKKCYIVCGGPEGCKSVEIKKDSFVICADSGYERAMEAGIKPDMLVGDFDSIASEIPKDIEIYKTPCEKDDTDTSTAIKIAIRRGFDDITLLSACGGRLDHTFANIQMMNYIRKQGGKACMLGDEVKAYLLCSRSIELKNSDSYISLFAISDTCEVSAKGVKYPLDHYMLTNAFPLGVSNEFAEDTCRIRAHRGVLLVMEVKK